MRHFSNSLAGRVGSVLLAAGAAGVSPCRAQTWDAVAEFSLAANPNGPWSYGWTPSVGGAFNAMPSVCFGAQWCVPSTGTHWPYVSGATPGALGIHPKQVGGTYWYSVVRWTAPSSRFVTISGSWGHQPGAGGVSVDARVLHNGTVLSGTYAYVTFGNSAPFSASLFVTTGDTIDFVVGSGGNGDGQDGGTLTAAVAVQCALALSGAAGPGSILIQNSGCTPNGVYVTAATAVQGAFPNGWFYGVDIPFFELFALPAFGPPFFGPFDANGGSSFFVPGGLPSGLHLFAVTVDVDLSSGLAFASSAPVSFVIP